MYYNQEELKKIPGVKIRRQYFRGILYWGMIIFGLSLSFCLLFDIIYIFVCVLIFLVVVLPVFLNRFFFGEIICVLNEEGIYYCHGFIEWKAIETVEFDIEKKGRGVPTDTNVYIMGKSGKPRLIYNIPYFALRKMKKYKPTIQRSFTERGKWMLIVFLIVAAIFVLILPLVIFLLSI